MRISLERFLRTGQFGALTSGMSSDQIRALLGEPDAVGCASEKHRHPTCWLYGSVELHFRHQHAYDLVSIFWDAAEKGPVRLPAHCIVADWTLASGMARPEVEFWLRDREIEFVFVHASPEFPTAALLLPNGVQITFDAHEQLSAIYAGQ
jgi:hypothetical protein